MQRPRAIAARRGGPHDLGKTMQVKLAKRIKQRRAPATRRAFADLRRGKVINVAEGGGGQAGFDCLRQRRAGVQAQDLHVPATGTGLLLDALGVGLAPGVGQRHPGAASQQDFGHQFAQTPRSTHHHGVLAGKALGRNLLHQVSQVRLGYRRRPEKRVEGAHQHCPADGQAHAAKARVAALHLIGHGVPCGGASQRGCGPTPQFEFGINRVLTGAAHADDAGGGHQVGDALQTLRCQRQSGEQRLRQRQVQLQWHRIGQASQGVGLRKRRAERRAGGLGFGGVGRG